MKNKKLKIGMIIVSMTVIGFMPLQADTIRPGNKFSINLRCNNVEGTVRVSSSNATVTSAGNWCNRGENIQVSAIAGKAGVASFSLIGVDATGNANTQNPIDYSGKVISSNSVTIVANQPKPEVPAKPDNNVGSKNDGSSNNTGNNDTYDSNDANTTDPTKKADDNQKETKKSSNSSLSSLQINKGKIKPDFKSNITSYKVTLDNTVTEINVSAKAAHANASIVGVGKKALEPGNNSIKITCVAEDGSETTYTILAYVSEKPLTTLQYSGKELGVLRNVKDAPALSKAFKEVKIKVNGVEATAWKNEALDITLLYLQHENGKDYYIFDEMSQSIQTIYRPMSLLGTNVIMIDVTKELQKREGMTFTEVEVDGQKLPGWTFNDQTFHNYVLIYVMDESGNKKYYQYEKSEQRLQLYSGAASITQKEYDNYRKDTNNKEDNLLYIIYGLSAGCVILLGVAGYLFVKRKKNNTHDRVVIEADSYKERFH